MRVQSRAVEGRHIPNIPLKLHRFGKGGKATGGGADAQGHELHKKGVGQRGDDASGAQGGVDVGEERQERGRSGEGVVLRPHSQKGDAD